MIILSLPLLFQQPYILICRCPANPAQPRKFRQIECPVPIRRVVLEKA